MQRVCVCKLETCKQPNPLMSGMGELAIGKQCSTMGDENQSGRRDWRVAQSKMIFIQSIGAPRGFDV